MWKSLTSTRIDWNCRTSPLRMIPVYEHAWQVGVRAGAITMEMESGAPRAAARQRRSGAPWLSLPAAVCAALAAQPHAARATDEIQLYNAEIADVGQFT